MFYSFIFYRIALNQAFLLGQGSVGIVRVNKAGIYLNFDWVVARIYFTCWWLIGRGSVELTPMATASQCVGCTQWMLVGLSTFISNIGLHNLLFFLGNVKVIGW